MVPYFGHHRQDVDKETNRFGTKL